MSGRKRLLAAILICVTLCGCSAATQPVTIVPDGDTDARPIVAATTPLADEEREGHRLIARNTAYSLYLREDTLSVILEKNGTGRILRSAVAEPDENDQPAWTNFSRSGIAIEYYVGNGTTAQRADMLTKEPEKVVTRTEDGFAAQIAYTGLGIRFTVFVSLTEEGMTAEVPQASIQETGRNKLAALYLYPFLGYTFLGEQEGYMLIPDGSGALISLQDNEGKYVQPYTAAVYGEDYGITSPYTVIQAFDGTATTYRAPQQVVAPVFGMVHTDRQIGFLGVIEKGQYNAQILAYPNGVVTQYNWITAKFVYRQTYIYPTTRTTGVPMVQTQRNSFDAKIRWNFVSGEDADYAGLACTYRSYLEKNGMLQAGGGSAVPLSLDFFAGDVQEAALGYFFVATTTLEQLTSMCRELSEAGVASAVTVYKGWQPNGIYGTSPASLKLQSSLGNSRQLAQTASTLRELGMPLRLYTDTVKTYSTSGYDSASYVYGLYERMLKLTTQKDLHEYQYRYTPFRSTAILQGQQADVQKVGAEGLAIGDMSYTLSSSLQQGQLLSRQQTAQIYAQQIQAGTVLYNPCDYLWKSSTAFLNIPLSTSQYQFVSEEIPFFALALSGDVDLYGDYVNFQAEPKQYFLRMIAAGVCPSFLLMKEEPSSLAYTDSRDLFSCSYAEYKEEVVQYYQAFAALKQATGNASIVDYRQQAGVSVTVYANGCRVYVNTTDTEAVLENVTIAAQSYVVKEETA